jgi:hypothetical protein
LPRAENTAYSAAFHLEASHARLMKSWGQSSPKERKPMPNRNLTVRHSSGRLAALQGNQTAKQVAAIQEAAFIERSRRSTERDLGLLEMADVEILTARGIAAASNIAGQAVAEIAANPVAADGVARLLNTGNGGLDRVLRRYLDE